MTITNLTKQELFHLVQPIERDEMLKVNHRSPLIDVDISIRNIFFVSTDVPTLCVPLTQPTLAAIHSSPEKQARSAFKAKGHKPLANR